MHEKHYLDDALRQFRKLKDLADAAMAQIPGAAWFTALDEESNSIAMIMKHVAGNMRSRWTRFLTSDGEKADRDRDSEFERTDRDSKETISERWEVGWRCAFDAISSLAPDDLGKAVRIRGEEHSVMEAINRQLTHYAYHVGQIVLLAKHFAAGKWKSLSIPRGKSREFEVAKDGAVYKPDQATPPRGEEHSGSV